MSWGWPWLTALSIIWWPMCRWAYFSRPGWIRVRSRPWPPRGKGSCIPSPWDFRNYGAVRSDETSYAAKIAARYGTVHQTQWITREDFAGDYQRILEVMDQPATDGVNMYFVAKIAAAAGMKTALSGLGGDELFGGYPSFRDIPRMARTFSLAHSFPGLGRMCRKSCGTLC